MSEQNAEPKSDLSSRKKRKVKRKAKSPLNDTNINNGHIHGGAQASSRKGGAKAKYVSCVNKTNNKSNSNNSNNNNNNNNSKSKSNKTSNSIASAVSPGFCFLDPNKYPPIMSFSQDLTNQQQPAGAVQGVSVLNPGAYNMSPTQPLPAQQIYNVPPPPAAGLPGWVSELIQDVKQIKLSITKLDQIERTVNSINMKVTDLELKVNSMEPRVFEVEKACTFISDENDERRKELERTKAEVSKLRTDCTNMQTNTNYLRTRNSALEAKVTDLESRSMRDNLLFYGITERGQHENCEGLVKGVCIETLGLAEADNMTFDRVHRVGTFSKNKVRPIVAKFHYFREREIVRQKAYENNAALKRENLGIGQQWPSEVRETRKALFPIMQREKSQGNTVKLVKDKLFVNDVEYRLPHQQQPQVPASQTQRFIPPETQTPGWYHGQAQSNQFNSLPQQSPPRQWVPPPPPVPPGQPGSFQWTSPIQRMTPPMPTMQQSGNPPFMASQQIRHTTSTQQQNSGAQQGPSQQNQPSQQMPETANDMQHDGR